MRKRDSGLSDEQATLVVCSACGSECDRHNVQMLQPETRKEGARLTVCETCFEEMPDDFADGEWEHLIPEKWAKVEDWARRRLILSFIPASEQINDVRDVEEFFDALTAYLIWHPDNRFNDYINLESKKRIFGEGDAEALDKAMDRCRDVCERLTKAGADVYELGMNSLEKAGLADKAPEPEIQRKFDETRAAEAKRITKKPGHVATAADRAKDPYLSADSIVYETEAPKHTPGPWVVDDRHIHPAKGLTYPPGVEPETDVILLVDTDQHDHGLLNETDKANLRLAAAAPELLELLRQCLDVQVRYYDEHEGCPTFVEELSAAIAKAEGREA